MFGTTELLLILAAVALFVLLPRLQRKLEDRVDETALGQQALAELRAQSAISPLEGGLPERILAEFRRVHRLRVPQYRIHLSEQVGINAMALPGGIAVLTSGLMDRVDSGEITEPELAAVLAHELAHIELGHGRAAAVRQTLSGWAGKALAARALGPLALFWLPAGMKSLSRGATRAAELQADAWAYSMLQRTRYDPEALVSILTKLGAWQRGHGLWSTHPTPRSRIAALKARSS
jgi:putative metalloprotease